MIISETAHRGNIELEKGRRHGKFDFGQEHPDHGWPGYSGHIFDLIKL